MLMGGVAVPSRDVRNDARLAVEGCVWSTLSRGRAGPGRTLPASAPRDRDRAAETRSTRHPPPRGREIVIESHPLASPFPLGRATSRLSALISSQGAVLY